MTFPFCWMFIPDPSSIAPFITFSMSFVVTVGVTDVLFVCSIRDALSATARASAFTCRLQT